MRAKSVTLDWKVFVGLITALVGTGSYATLCPAPSTAATASTAPLEHKIELRDTAQAWQNRYMLDSIARVGAKVEKMDRKLDTMMARQERYLTEVLESVNQGNRTQLAARCPIRTSAYTMLAP